MAAQGRSSKKPVQLSRKEARKQGRASQKFKRAQYFSNSTHPRNGKRVAEEEHEESPQRKRNKLDQPKPLEEKRVTKVQTSQSKAEGNEASSFNSEKIGKPLVQEKTKREQDDDAYIAYLESKLGYSKGKKTKMGDGLDGAYSQIC
jgi:nucleolar MIF4G domain-containing protein 1